MSDEMKLLIALCEAMDFKVKVNTVLKRSPLSVAGDTLVTEYKLVRRDEDETTN